MSGPPRDAAADGVEPDARPALRHPRPAPPRTLVGGVGYRWQRDASFGLAVTDRLAGVEWPAEVEVADLGYGALHVADDLARARPAWERLILVAALPRDRDPGSLHRRDWKPEPVPPEEIQARIREAGGGVVDLDHLLVIAQHMEALPPEVVLYELEPEDMQGGEGMSPTATARLHEAVRRIRTEVMRPAEPPEEAAGAS